MKRQVKNKAETGIQTFGRRSSGKMTATREGERIVKKTWVHGEE